MRIYSKKFIWSRSRARKLLRMKLVGHKGYTKISGKIGCSPSDAQSKFLETRQYLRSCGI